MKNFKFFFILAFFSIFLFLSQSEQTFGHDKENEKDLRMEIKADLKEELEEIKNIINKFKIKSNINKKEFEMKGMASDVTETSFTLNGETILIDISITGKLMQRGVLKNGSYVKVEGKVIDGKLYVVHIKVSSQSPTITPSVSPSPTLSPTPTPSLTPTPTPTGTSLLIENEVEENRLLVQDILETIKKFLEELRKELMIIQVRAF